jgi:hypothetical protein
MPDKVIILEGECDLADDIAPEYDLANMKVDVERTRRFRAYGRTRMVRLDPDIIEFFKTPEAVNDALRALIRLMGEIGQARKMKDAA